MNNKKDILIQSINLFLCFVLFEFPCFEVFAGRAGLSGKTPSLEPLEIPGSKGDYVRIDLEVDFKISHKSMEPVSENNLEKDNSRMIMERGCFLEIKLTNRTKNLNKNLTIEYEIQGKSKNRHKVTPGKRYVAEKGETKVPLPFGWLDTKTFQTKEAYFKYSKNIASFDAKGAVVPSLIVGNKYAGFHVKVVDEDGNIISEKRS